jgi:aminoglycoside phosphotransferase (APT) family kinase protein
VDITALVTRKQADPAARAEATRRESALLTVIRPWCTLPIPEPRSDVDVGYRKLAGRALRGRPLDSAAFAETLGRFVSELHQVPLPVVAGLVPTETEPLTAALAEAQRYYRAIAAVLPRPARRLVEDFLARPAPPEPTAMVFCHNDLGTEHVLVDGPTVTGVIDWTDAAIADPVRDLALFYRDLGPDMFERILGHYQGPRDDHDRQRAVFYARWALLDDIEYRVRVLPERYAVERIALLDRTFVD